MLRRSGRAIVLAALLCLAEGGSATACSSFGTQGSDVFPDASTAEHPDGGAVEAGGDVSAPPVGCCPACTTIVANQANPAVAIELLGSNLLWANAVPSGGIYTCTSAKCEPTLLAMAATATSLSYFSLSSIVLYATDSSLFTVATTPPSSGVRIGDARRIVRQGPAASAYWLDSSGIQTCAAPNVNGCKPSLYWASTTVTSFDVNTSAVYWTTINGRVEGCEKMGSCSGPPIEIATAQDGVGPIIVDGTQVFWAIGGPSGKIRVATRNTEGSTPRVIASDQNDPVAFANNYYDVFWVNKGSGTVMRAPKNANGISPDVLACDLKSPTAIALSEDSPSLIVANAGAGSIVRIPIPAR